MNIILIPGEVGTDSSLLNAFVIREFWPNI